MLLSVSLFLGRTLHTLHGACTMYNADCRHWAAKVDKVHGEGGYWIQCTVHYEGGQHIAQCTDHIQLQRCMNSAHCESNQSKRGEYSAQCKERHSALQRCIYIAQCKGGQHRVHTAKVEHPAMKVACRGHS